MSALEVAQRAFAGGAGLVRVVRERSLMLRFAANRPTQSTAIDDVTVEIAVLRGGHVGRASTNRTDDAGLAACRARAERAAVAATAAGPGTHPVLMGNEVGSAVAGGFDEETAALPPEGGGSALSACFEAARGAGVEAHGIWTVGAQEAAVAGASGAVEERTTDAYMKVICMDPASGRSGYAARTGRAVGDLDGRALAGRAAARATFAGEAAELPPGEHPVVMEPAAVGELLDLLATSALNGLAHVEGRGALDGRLGTPVAAPAINLADAPDSRLTLPHGFDAEGTPKRPLPLIEDGVARNVVHDRRSAALAGTESTGHALAAGGDPHGPHPLNLVLAGGGAAGVEELCARVERGVYVTRLWYTNVVRPKETLVTGVTRDGTFLVENGRITRPLRDLRLTASILGMLSRVTDLTAAQELTSTGDFYGRRMAYGVVCPAVRIGAVRFTGPAG